MDLGDCPICEEPIERDLVLLRPKKCCARYSVTVKIGKIERGKPLIDDDQQESFHPFDHEFP